LRYSKEQKAESRDRIVGAAAELFRERGIDGVGVDAIMARAGLTHGGFYNHFRSKEELVREACAAALEGSTLLAEARSGRDDGFRHVVETYLSSAHCRNRRRGCAIAALGGELARHEAATRRPFAAAVRGFVDGLAALLPGRRPAARRRALAAAATLVGTLVLARISDDPDFAEELLEAGRRALLEG
jgi:TetR/AcrR family transcriptional repressor of nem operon